MVSIFLAAKGLVDSFVDNVVIDTVRPIKGSILYCDLHFGLGEHSGVYIGDNQIVHLDGSGEIEIVDPDEFLDRLDGANSAISIYVSCNDKSAVGSNAVARRAKKMVGNYRDYNVILDNCHQFSSGCITGDFENTDNFLWALKRTARAELGANNWRVWETVDGEYVE